MPVLLVFAGDDRRKADRAVSMVAIAGNEPVGSARILGSNMVERCVWLRCVAVDCAAMPFNFSTFCRLRNLHSVWHRVENGVGIHPGLLMPLLLCLCFPRSYEAVSI